MSDDTSESEPKSTGWNFVAFLIFAAAATHYSAVDADAMKVCWVVAVIAAFSVRPWFGGLVVVFTLFWLMPEYRGEF